MHYRIAEITLRSQFTLPSFEAFACEPAKPDVTLNLMEEVPVAKGEETAAGCGRVRKTDDGWFFHSESSADSGLLASRDYTMLQLKPKETGKIVPYDELLIRLALECLLIWRGYAPLHASCVELDGQTFAFTGPSNIGKSTRAAVWINTLGARLVSGDGPLIRVNDTEVFGVPWDAEECCYRSIHLPLAALCEVRRSSSVYVRKMSFRQKMNLLARRCFIPKWDIDATAAEIVNLSRLAERFEIVRAFCGPGAEDARLLLRLLSNHQIKEKTVDMKAKQGFVLRNIAGEYLLMPTGENISSFNGAVILNEVSAFIWEEMKQPVSQEDLLQAILDKYDVEEKKAKEDLSSVLKMLQDLDLIEED